MEDIETSSKFRDKCSSTPTSSTNNQQQQNLSKKVQKALTSATDKSLFLGPLLSLSTVVLHAEKSRANQKKDCNLAPINELDIDNLVNDFNLYKSNDNLTEEEKKVNLALGLDSLKITDTGTAGSVLNVPMNSRTLPSAHSALILMVQNAADHMLHISSNNKVTKKVFRSDDSIEKEQLRQFQSNRYIIHPFSRFRWYWEIILVVVLAIDLVILPIQIAFFENEGSAWVGIMLFFDVVFMLDIIINFRTGIVSDTSQVILDSKTIAIHYLKTYFFIDLCSTVPFDKFYEVAVGSEATSTTAGHVFTVFRLVKILSLLRVLRMSRLLRYVQKLEEFLNIQESFIRIINLVVFILLLSHWNGCMQYFAVKIEKFPEDSWVALNKMTNDTIWKLYTLSVFKATSHMLSIGYGRAPPLSMTDIWLTMFSMLLGASFYALFIANMSSLLIGIDYSGRLYNEKLAQVKEYMKFRHVPKSTKDRVVQYYEQKYQRKYFDELEILSDKSVSSGLRKEILLHNCQSLVEKVPFLAKGPPEFIMDIIGHLKFEVFLVNDYIINAGAIGQSMFFIEHGGVEIILPNGKVVNRLGDGCYFGEIALMMDERRVASVVAVENCDVFVLTRESFKEILTEHHYMQEIMQSVAEERMQAIRRILEPNAFIDDDSDEEDGDHEHVIMVGENTSLHENKTENGTSDDTSGKKKTGKKKISKIEV